MQVFLKITQMSIILTYLSLICNVGNPKVKLCRLGPQNCQWFLAQELLPSTLDLDFLETWREFCNFRSRHGKQTAKEYYQCRTYNNYYATLLLTTD